MKERKRKFRPGVALCFVGMLLGFSSFLSGMTYIGEKHLLLGFLLISPTLIFSLVVLFKSFYEVCFPIEKTNKEDK